MTKFSSRLSQISLALVMAFGAVNFTACGEDMSKAPLVSVVLNPVAFIKLQSQDDTTIINKITISGKDGVCKVDDDFGAGGSFFGADKVLYGEVITFDDVRVAEFSSENCPSKNGKYKVEVATNLGTYTYEIQ